MARKALLMMIVGVLVCPFASFGQSREYIMDHIKWSNPWLEGGNMASLALIGAFLTSEMKSLGEANLTVAGSAGDLKDIFVPEKEIDGSLDVRSYLRQGGIWLYGRFGYDYDYGTGSRWRGYINPYNSPFMVTDSIPGSISKETYAMEAGMAIPVGRAVFGVDVDYSVALMAKHKDLRNKNTAMDFRISPGFMYSGDTFRGGLHLGYGRSTEKVEYMQVEENRECYLFDIYGLWLYNSNGFSSAESKRLVQDNLLFGGVQMDFDFDRVRIFNEFALNYSTAVQSETMYNNLRYGDTRTLSWSENLMIFFGKRHLLEFSTDISTMLGYRYTQRQELDPASRIRKWVTYGDPVNCYVRRSDVTCASYTFRRFNDNNISWALSVGAGACGMFHSYSEYPHLFSQGYTTLEPFASFEKNFGRGKERFSLIPKFSYRIVTESVPVAEEDRQYLLVEPLDEQWKWWSCDKAIASLSFGWTHEISTHSSVRIKGAVNGIWAAPGSRYSASLSFGYLF